MPLRKRSAVKCIQEYNADRLPSILKFKYKAMSLSAFSFLRGSCHLFSQDFAAKPPLKNDPTSVWVCGDMHLENFGAFKGDNGLAYFDINDFDESTRAPVSLDLSRFLVSLQLAQQTIDTDQKEINALSEKFLSKFQDVLEQGKSLVIERTTSTGVIKSFLRRVSERSRKEFIAEQTFEQKGKLKLFKSKDHWLKIDEKTSERVSAALEKYNKSIPSIDRYKLLDIAYRLAGTGSLGLERYVVLAQRHDRTYFLDIKYTQKASFDLYMEPAVHWDNDADRIISVQKMMQHVPPALLTRIQIKGQSYVMRELQPLKDKVDFTSLDSKKWKLDEVVESMAEMAASAYLRSSGWMKSSTIDDLVSFANQNDWKKTLLAFAKEYSDQVKDDYEQFMKAYKNKVL